MRLALYVCLKNICDGVGGQDESNGTPLDPPLFWLDNIFKQHLHYKLLRYHLKKFDNVERLGKVFTCPQQYI